MLSRLAGKIKRKRWQTDINCQTWRWDVLCVRVQLQVDCKQMGVFIIKSISFLLFICFSHCSALTVFQSFSFLIKLQILMYEKPTPVLPGILAKPLNTASWTALIPIPSTFRPLPNPLLASSEQPIPLSPLACPNILGGLPLGRLAYFEGITADGRVFGCNEEYKRETC